MRKGPVIQCAQCGGAIMNGLSIGPTAVAERMVL